MPTKSYTQMSSFWYLGVPAVILGLGYYLWNSHGFVAAQMRQVLSPIVSFLARLFSGLI